MKITKLVGPLLLVLLGAASYGAEQRAIAQLTDGQISTFVAKEPLLKPLMGTTQARMRGALTLLCDAKEPELSALLKEYYGIEGDQQEVAQAVNDARILRQTTQTQPIAQQLAFMDQNGGPFDGSTAGQQNQQPEQAPVTATSHFPRKQQLYFIGGVGRVDNGNYSGGGIMYRHPLIKESYCCNKVSGTLGIEAGSIISGRYGEKMGSAVTPLNTHLYPPQPGTSANYRIDSFVKRGFVSWEFLGFNYQTRPFLKHIAFETGIRLAALVHDSKLGDRPQIQGKPITCYGQNQLPGPCGNDWWKNVYVDPHQDVVDAPGATGTRYNGLGGVPYVAVNIVVKKGFAWRTEIDRTLAPGVSATDFRMGPDFSWE